MKLKQKKAIWIPLSLCVIVVLACILLVALRSNKLSDDIVILYTNDVHTYIDGPVSYDTVAAIRGELEEKYEDVLLVDAGDHIQGTAYGAMDQGKTIIELMNAAEYDVATLGNHEIDYGMQGCLKVLEWAEYPYVSCNFYHEKDGTRLENLLDSYVLLDCGDEKIAFVGITTPETLSKTAPTHFQDENGAYIYGISGGTDGSDLYNDVQIAIDAAKAAGATQVIALGHLGVDPSSQSWTSEETIAHVSGLDAFIDGHSHTVMEGKEIADKDGNEVLLTQTGEYLGSIGMMVIDSKTGDITTDLIELVGNEEDGFSLSSDIYGGKQIPQDETVKEKKENWILEIDAVLGEVIGKVEVTLDNFDENGNRLVRSHETNTGDFSADALYYLFDNMELDVDVAVMNGGGIRNQSLTGDVSYKSCKDIHPYGNVACLLTVSGQQILDVLEWGARNVGVMEDGSFLQVSGVIYKLDSTIANTTQADEKDIWIGGPEKYRVHDVKVYNKETNTWDALDLEAEYNLAGYNYTLRDLGGGFAMLNGSVNVLDYVMEDYMVLANYIAGFEETTVKAKNSPLLAKYPGLLIDYSEVEGNGRISIITEE